MNEKFSYNGRSPAIKAFMIERQMVMHFRIDVAVRPNAGGCFRGAYPAFTQCRYVLVFGDIAGKHGWILKKSESIFKTEGTRSDGVQIFSSFSSVAPRLSLVLHSPSPSHFPQQEQFAR